MRFSVSAFALLSAGLAMAAPAPVSAPGGSSIQLDRRADTSNITEISHNAVVGFSETVPATSLGSLYLKYKPYLYRYNGCVPFPAVNAAGDVGGGLSPTGSPSGLCTQSTGQVYVRGAWYGSQYGIMYSWYMPKDEPSTGLGHRHDWENAIIWIDSPDVTSPKIVGLSTSAHGGYATIKSDFSSHFNGNSAFIEYISNWPINHQLVISTTQGLMQPLIAYESLTYQARYTLENWDFGSANVPFKEANMASNLEKAWAADS
ncbi:putative necrosis- and ethylene-inducing protein2 precursor protein [Ceratocystis lukuohia]|uniref:Necrosis- and ethylene-inducing protein2 protein n=1 Tax=Ceratocystis lukuohia TaxID=2019550 RepID=A0ABR4MNC3_9PEZI